MNFSHPDELEVSKLTLGLVGDFPCGIISDLTLRGEGNAPREFECVYLPVEHQGRNVHILEIVNPLCVAYRREDREGAFQALRYHQTAFIDIGTGTPLNEGPLARAETSCSLEDFVKA